jgi:hypothetical protein
VGDPLGGLDVPVNPQDDLLGGVPDSSALPPLSLARPKEQVDLATTEPDSGDGPSDFDDPNQQPAIGNSLLFNVSESRKLRLEFRRITAGRGKDNDIVLADANASRVHLQLTQDATGKWKLKDLNSTNGTLLNGRPVNVAILRDGDEITVGMTILEFRQ